jgi:WD40 repeat protein
MESTFSLHQVFEAKLPGYCSGFHFPPAGAWLWAGTSEGDLAALSTADGTIARYWTADPLGLQHMSGSVSAPVLLTAGNSGNVQFWQENGELIQALKMPNAWLDAAAWSPDGSAVILCMGKSVMLVKVTGEIGWKTTDLPFTPFAVAWAPHGRQIAIAGNGGIACLQALTGEVIRKIHWNAAFISLFWGHDPIYLFSGTHDGALHVWKLDELEPHYMAMQGYGQPVSMLSACHSGSYLAVPSHADLVLWHLKESQGLKKSLPAIDSSHEQAITALAFRPEGFPLLASGNRKGGLLLSGIQGHALTTYSTGQTEGEITCLVWKPYASHLAMGTSRGNICYFSCG